MLILKTLPDLYDNGGIGVWIASNPVKELPMKNLCLKAPYKSIDKQR